MHFDAVDCIGFLLLFACVSSFLGCFPILSLRLVHVECTLHVPCPVLRLRKQVPQSMVIDTRPYVFVEWERLLWDSGLPWVERPVYERLFFFYSKKARHGNRAWISPYRPEISIHSASACHMTGRMHPHHQQPPSSSSPTPIKPLQ